MADETTPWVSRKLADPAFRVGVQQELASEQFCDALEAVLEQNELTRAELARRLGRSRAYITKALRRGRNLTIKTMVELLAACGYEIEISAHPADEPKASLLPWIVHQQIQLLPGTEANPIPLHSPNWAAIYEDFTENYLVFTLSDQELITREEEATPVQLVLSA